jgi:fructose-bisphosphate aldolase class II
MDSMRKWSRKNRRDIKFATGVFKDDIDSIPEDNARQIHDMAYREAKELIAAFRARGSATRLALLLEEAGCA